MGLNNEEYNYPEQQLKYAASGAALGNLQAQQSRQVAKDWAASEKAVEPLSLNAMLDRSLHELAKIQEGVFLIWNQLSDSNYKPVNPVSALGPAKDVSAYTKMKSIDAMLRELARDVEAIGVKVGLKKFTREG